MEHVAAISLPLPAGFRLDKDPVGLFGSPDMLVL